MVNFEYLCPNSGNFKWFWKILQQREKKRARESKRETEVERERAKESWFERPNVCSMYAITHTKKLSRSFGML